MSAFKISTRFLSNMEEEAKANEAIKATFDKSESWYDMIIADESKTPEDKYNEMIVRISEPEGLTDEKSAVALYKHNLAELDRRLSLVPKNQKPSQTVHLTKKVEEHDVLSEHVFLPVDMTGMTEIGDVVTIEFLDKDDRYAVSTVPIKLLNNVATLGGVKYKLKLENLTIISQTEVEDVRQEVKNTSLNLTREELRSHVEWKLKSGALKSKLQSIMEECKSEGIKMTVAKLSSYQFPDLLPGANFGNDARHERFRQIYEKHMGTRSLFAQT